MSFGRPPSLQIDGCTHDGGLPSNYDSHFIADYLYYLPARQLSKINLKWQQGAQQFEI